MRLRPSEPRELFGSAELSGVRPLIVVLQAPVAERWGEHKLDGRPDDHASGCSKSRPSYRGEWASTTGLRPT